jgi:hypothetical protein
MTLQASARITGGGGGMKTDLTDKQRQALEHVERARSAGLRLSDYAREQGVEIRSIYDSMAALRKKGLLAQIGVRESAFVAVRVKAVAKSEPVPGSAPGGLICRLRIGSVLIECGQWPPAAWVVTLASGRADAAP